MRKLFGGVWMRSRVVPAVQQDDSNIGPLSAWNELPEVP